MLGWSCPISRRRFSSTASSWRWISAFAPHGLRRPEIDQIVGGSGSSADVVMLKGASFRLELFQYHAPQHSDTDPGGLDAHELGLRHLAILVDDVVSELNRLIALGGSKINDPVQVGTEMSVYCHDPFGTIIELLA